jgi:hypothetical protein
VLCRTFLLKLFIIPSLFALFISLFGSTDHIFFSSLQHQIHHSIHHLSLNMASSVMLIKTRVTMTSSIVPFDSLVTSRTRYHIQLSTSYFTLFLLLSTAINSGITILALQQEGLTTSYIDHLIPFTTSCQTHRKVSQMR